MISVASCFGKKINRCVGGPRNSIRTTQMTLLFADCKQPMMQDLRHKVSSRYLMILATNWCHFSDLIIIENTILYIKLQRLAATKATCQVHMEMRRVEQAYCKNGLEALSPDWPLSKFYHCWAGTMFLQICSNWVNPAWKDPQVSSWTRLGFFFPPTDAVDGAKVRPLICSTVEIACSHNWFSGRFGWRGSTAVAGQGWEW